MLDQFGEACASPKGEGVGRRYRCNYRTPVRWLQRDVQWTCRYPVVASINYAATADAG